MGKRSSLPGDLRNDFLASGLIHVVAISGFNITLVALAVRRLAGWLIGRYSVLLAMLALPLYAALAGGEPSVVRATLMGELILLAWLLGRDTDALTALAAAALAIVLIDPSALADVGFQLSFAGTLGLVVIAPGLSEWLRMRVRLPRLAAEPLAVTATASLMVTPIIAHTFERLQLAAIPANLLALAAPVWIMATGAPVAVWAAAGWPFGEVLAWAAWVPLEYLIQAARPGRHAAGRLRPNPRLRPRPRRRRLRGHRPPGRTRRPAALANPKCPHAPHQIRCDRSGPRRLRAAARPGPHRRATPVRRPGNPAHR